MKQRKKLGLFLPSTLRFIKAGRTVKDYRLSDALHGLFYGKYTYFYIGFGTGKHWVPRLAGRVSSAWRRLSGKRRAEPRTRYNPVPTAYETGGKMTFADGYHGKVIPLESARQLVTVNEPIRLPDLEKVIPYGRARDLILENPSSIAVLDCPCRSSRENPCLPLDVCLIVGEPFTSFVLEHHPSKAHRITQDEAVDILRAEDERGHVHHAFFKDAMLNRFYAICNCCECCCGAMKAHNTGNPMLASSGYECRVDEDLCIGCGECAPYCQFEALSVNGTAQVSAVDCMGCGVCISKCPQEALALVRVESRGEPLEIYSLMDLASHDRAVHSN